MLGTPQFKRPESLKKLAEVQIREGIIRGRFRLGEPLPEAKLADELGISRTPIREALGALHLQGLVKIFPQRGAFVFTLSREDIEHLCRYRTILEFNAVDLAIERDRRAFLLDLERVLSEMSAARSIDDFERYLDLDAEFHDTFFNFSGNAYLKDGYQKVGDIVRTIRTYLSRGPSRTDKSFAEHEDIIKFLMIGQLGPAKEVLKRQITRGERAYAELTNTSPSRFLLPNSSQPKTNSAIFT